MLRFEFGSPFLTGVDSLFSLIALIVTFIIAMYSLQVYGFSKENKYKYFALSFLAIAASFGAKIIANLDVLAKLWSPLQATTAFLQGSTAALSWLVLLHNFVLLLGFLGLYLILSHFMRMRHWPLLVYLMFMTALLTLYKFDVLNITIAVLLVYTCIYALKNYITSKNVPALFVCVAFISLLISQILFAIVQTQTYLYFAAEIFQTIGYLSFLGSYMQVTRGGTHRRKKNKA